MKVPLPKYQLKSLSNSGFGIISTEDVDNVLQEMHNIELKRRKEQILRRFDSQTKTRIRHMSVCPRQLQPQPLCQTFKKPSSPQHSPLPSSSFPAAVCFQGQTHLNHELPGDHNSYTMLPGNLQTPKVKTVQLFNLSYSRPSTPKAQAHAHHTTSTLETPSLQNRKNHGYNGFTHNNFTVPLTPMLSDPLQVLQKEFNGTGFNDSSVIDLLQMIDDDSKPVEIIDKALHKYSDVVINDSNVADYLLDISEDYKPMPKAATERNTITVLKFGSRLSEENPKRKCRRAKPISFEDSLVYEDQRKAMEKIRKQKRKEFFRQESSRGSRRSQRATTKRVRYF